MMQKFIILVLVLFIACNKSEEIIPIPIPNVAGEWDHKYNFLNSLTFTKDSIFIQSSSSYAYEQLNDSILILENDLNKRTANYKLVNDAELYFSFGRSYNINPLKYLKDSVIYEIYLRKK